ncbi:ABC transporter ATP-binding protein [Methanospirillum sp.]|uniref:ABC transporter ATP-binding protein n=1 Tax=Methanospirillum sp. TaxID=45200 RepID=UPI0035A08BB9
MNIKLSVQNLEFAYQSTPVISGMNMEIPKGNLVSILGPNGSGKSTFIKCVDRILNPKKGIISVDGESISSCTRRDLAKMISYVPQSSVRIFPHSVFDMILMGRRPHLGWVSSGEDEERVWDVIALLGLEEIALHSFNELSGGQQQKVLIARALVQETDLMLLDEPTSNLDIWHQLDVMRIVSDLVGEQQITTLMAVHDLNIASRFSDLIILMEKGSIHAAGKPCDVLTSENIAEVYGVKADVHCHDGVPIIIPYQQIHGNGSRKTPFFSQIT